MRTECIPLLTEAGIHVLLCEASASAEDDREEAILIRAFRSLHEHASQEAAFYKSKRWAEGPRDRLLACLVDYHSVTIRGTPETDRALAQL